MFLFIVHIIIKYSSSSWSELEAFCWALNYDFRIEAYFRKENTRAVPLYYYTAVLGIQRTCRYIVVNEVARIHVSGLLF